MPLLLQFLAEPTGPPVALSGNANAEPIIEHSMKNYHALRKLLSILLLGVMPAISGAAQPRSFHEVVDAYFEDYFGSKTSAATSVGFHQYYNQLEDFSL